MSSAIIVVTVLLGSSVAIAFVMQPSDREPAAPADAAVPSSSRCQGESWQLIRKGLLEALGLQTEPRLPAGGLERVREQWQRAFGVISHRVKDTASPVLSGPTVSEDGGNSTTLKCCSLISEVTMKDLGWDSWVLQPLSLVIVQCAHCSSAGCAVQCPAPHSGAQEAGSQDHLPCCQPTSFEMVPILYVDGHGTIVISSMRLPRSCGCEPGGVQPPSQQ